MNVGLKNIEQARDYLAGILPATPLVHNPWLSETLGCEIYLKLENMQPIGSFKIRGATYRISQLSAAEKKRGVIAASAGNHAQGVAWGSRHVGTHATIIMPRNAPLVKVHNTQSLGAEVILEGDTYDDAWAAAQEMAEKKKLTIIPAFDDPFIVAGQGTIGLEILEQLPDADFIIGSIGGGGMMSGTGIAIKGLKPKTQLIGVQAQGASSMTQSLQKGSAVKLASVQTFADGIAVKNASDRMRVLLKGVLDDWLTVPDDAIARAVLLLLEKGKIVAEGSAAITLAACQALRSKLKGKKVVALISGGNIDVNLLSRIIDRALIQEGRRVRVNVWLPDRPGSLARLTELVAAQGANVLQAIHDHNEPTTHIDETEVSLTLETRSGDHAKKLIGVLSKAFDRVELLHTP